jgi:hypothetical protein
MAPLVSQVGPPKLAQVDMALQSRIHQPGTAGLSNGGFDDCQRQFGDPQPVSFDNIRSRQVAPPLAHTVTVRMVACPWHRHFDSVGGKPREAVPPCGSHPTGRRSRSVTPDRRPDACGVGKRTVVDEVDAWRASPPLPRADTSADSVSAQSCALRLCKREDAVLITQILFEHS